MLRVYCIGLFIAVSSQLFGAAGSNPMVFVSNGTSYAVKVHKDHESKFQDGSGVLREVVPAGATVPLGSLDSFVPQGTSGNKDFSYNFYGYWLGSDEECSFVLPTQVKEKDGAYVITVTQDGLFRPVFGFDDTKPMVPATTLAALFARAYREFPWLSGEGAYKNDALIDLAQTLKAKCEKEHMAKLVLGLSSDMAFAERAECKRMLNDLVAVKIQALNSGIWTGSALEQDMNKYAYLKELERQSAYIITIAAQTLQKVWES